MGATSIEWTRGADGTQGHTINPFRARLRSDPSKVGHYCEKVSPGCTFCYSSRFQPRRSLPAFSGTHGRGLDLVEPFLDVTKLEEVLRRRKPTTYFWCDMTDMFGEWVSDEWIAACFGVMAATPQHTHQILTKRAERLPAWFSWIASFEAAPPGMPAVGDGWCRPLSVLAAALFRQPIPRDIEFRGDHPWPLPNVWLGVSVEDRKRLSRIDHLRNTPAAIRFLSIEPLIEDLGEIDLTGIDWVIVGGESGPDARPFDLAWPRGIMRQCREQKTKFFLKQVGARPYEMPLGSGRKYRVDDPAEMDAACDELQAIFDGTRFLKLRHKKGSNPAEWPEDLRVREMPEVRHA